MHKAKQTVLWKLEGQLELAMSVQFSAEYHRILTEARDRILEANETPDDEEP